ncbi:MAG: 16S rRNA (cytosine(967)-C(5))-methyltransferase RsmB [Acidobacteriota bacterium]
MKVSPARSAALEILNRIDVDRAFSSVLLPQYEGQLSQVDRGLCHELVLGVLRRRIYLDKIIESFTNAKKLDTAVRNALQIGAYQLIHLDKVPAYSAINESVNLVQLSGKRSAKGFVNAILRRISEKVPIVEFEDEVERVSVETSHPRWLLEKWISDFGFSEAEQIASANNTIPRVAFREAGDHELSQTNYQRSEIVEGAFIAKSIDSELREKADAGEIYFQDEGSQLVAQIASGEPRHRFLDVCAAPGGKTTQIARKYRGIVDALVVAGDLHESRVRLLRATCANQKLDSVNIVRYDAEDALPFADETFDTVLVDAPCSGTGTIRHNPEIRYFLAPDDFAELSRKQRKILKNASNVVRPGGRLIYSTCSIQIEENEEVVRGFLGESREFSLRQPEVPGRLLTDQGFARTFPHRDGTDGFFIACFDRIR